MTNHMGGRIRSLREERGWSRTQLAERITEIDAKRQELARSRGEQPPPALPHDRNTLYCWERGERIPRLDHLEALAEAFGLALRDLLTIDGVAATAPAA